MGWVEAKPALLDRLAADQSAVSTPDSSRRLPHGKVGGWVERLAATRAEQIIEQAEAVLARFVCPDREIRIAGGREMHLRSLQSLALQVANSIFLGDYLTSEGQDAEADLAMIRDSGFVVLGSDEEVAQRPTDPAIRRRGAGTDVLPNA